MAIRELFSAADIASSMASSASNSSAQLAASDCTRALSNTLTTQCFSSCQQSSPLCVNYAARPSNESLKEGDGDYYYQGCSYTYMSTCASSVGAAQCQLQCLQTKNELNEEWILDVNQPQADRLETSLFVHVDKLMLPSSLKHIKLVGTTEASRRVPMSFEKEAFTSGTGLQKITLMDLDIGAITANIFPSNLSTLIMQRTQLTTFEPAGGAQLAELRVLDLSENKLTTIPTAVFDYQGLSELHLQQNNISNVHLTSAQLSFLRQLDVFDATIQVSNGCSAGYTLYTWDTKSVCYGDRGGNDTLGGNIPQSDNDPSASSTAKTTKMGVIIASIAGFVVLAILVGIFFLKRAKKRKNDARKSLIPPQETHKLKLSASVRSLLSNKPSELANPLRDMNNGGLSPSRKSTFREIPAAEVRDLEVVAETSAVIVSLGEYNKKKVLINRLRISDDPAVNCETALGVAPVVAQLRHPQLLTVLGFMWEDVHTMSAICEHVDRGTLEDYLLSASTSLTWRNFKLKAAMEIASCLMYLHGQSYRLTYDGLSGRTVFVDSAKGCKLSTMIACLPNGLVKSHLAKTTRGFCAPEVMAGEASMPASDMYAFGVLLAQIDTCETAEQMIRSSLRQRSVREMVNFTDSNSTATSLQEDYTNSNSSRGGLLSSMESDGSNSSLHSLFGFTNECPEIVKELAQSCLQIDPKLRPSAQYVTAMLQHSL